jgi:Flp pilus assembly protein TadG
MGLLNRLFAHSRGSPRRAAILELAFVAPALALLLIGLVGWTGYFILARQVQKLADDALLAAAVTPYPRERQDLARAMAVMSLKQSKLAPAPMDLMVVTRGGRITVQLVYDASEAPLFALARLMPMPSPTIVRLASRPSRGE